MEKRLGRGLSALIPMGGKAKERTPDTVTHVAADLVLPNKNQPRKRFNDEKLKDLVDSIREKGVIQPVVVRPLKSGYEIIAGERRFRAMSELGYSNIPVIIKEVSDADSLEMSLIENIQREELNPVEEAAAYKKLAERFNFTQEEISKAVGKDKSTISNSLRLLTLPEAVVSYLEANEISTGHAKAILSLGTDAERIRYAKLIVKKGLSVRQIEEMIKSRPDALRRRPKDRDDNLRGIEEKLQHALGTKVKITQGKKRGKIVIQYYSHEDLERVVNIVSR